MPNITKAEGIESLYDFSRVESLEMLSYTKGCCPKSRRMVVMTMFSGTQHTWGEYVCRDRVAQKKYDALLDAIKIAAL